MTRFPSPLFDDVKKGEGSADEKTYQSEYCSQKKLGFTICQNNVVLARRQGDSHYDGVGSMD